MSSFAPLPLRAMIVIGFLYHGLPKFTAQGHQEFVGMLQASNAENGSKFRAAGLPLARMGVLL